MINLIGALDHESKVQYIFSVMGSIQTPVPMSAAASVVVNVLNKDDSGPLFIGAPYVVSVSESLLVGSLVAQLKANDPDKISTLTYSITAGNGDGKFQVDTSTGKITLQSSLNFDLVNSYRLNVSVSDSQRTAASVVQVNVLAVVKPPPTFVQYMYEVDVPETTPTSSSILKVGVSGTTPPYTLSVTEPNSVCAITADGTVTTTRALNYESDMFLICNLEVTDRHGTGYTTLFVNVRDVNDACPSIVSSDQSVQVTEPVVPNTIVATVVAKDDDTAALSYSVSGSLFFDINSNGHVFAKNIVNVPGTYNLEVTVSDGGSCPAVTTSMTITVTKVEINTFLFTKSEAMVSVSEDQSVPHDLISVKNQGATGATYGLAQSSGLFSVDPSSGMYRQYLIFR